MTQYVWNPKNLDSLIANLRRHDIIRSDRVEAVMRAVDRKFYCPENPDGYYFDGPKSIGYGVTIGAPHLHARVLELLSDHVKEGCKVLDVGCGSGFLTACFASMVGENGVVVGIDHLQELVDLAKQNIQRGNPDLLKEGSENRLKLVCGEGRKGWDEEAPYDAINVGAAGNEEPEELLKQLKPGGRLVCPIGDETFGEQKLVCFDKKEDGSVEKQEITHVRCMPLCDAKDHRSGCQHAMPPTVATS